MSKLYLFLFCVPSLFSLNAQEVIRYINPDNPLIETAVPSRDGNNNYHFNFTFNWINDSTAYSSKLNPKVDELEIYELGKEEPYRTYDAKADSKNQIQFKVKKDEIDQYDRVQYAIKWEISDEEGRRISHRTKFNTIRLNFGTDPELKYTLADDGIYFTDDVNRPRLKIRTNKDGTAVKKLVLKNSDSDNAPVLAKITDKITRINSNIFTELVFTTENGVQLAENAKYYLYGDLINSGLQVSIPTNGNSNEFKLREKEKFYIKPMLPEGNIISVKGNSDFSKILDASGEISDLKATLNLGNNGKRVYTLNNLGYQRWELKIPGDSSVANGVYNLEFSGTGKNGLPIQPSIFSFIKKPIQRKILQMEITDDVYSVVAEFDETPKVKVYLVVDGFDIQMDRSSSDGKKFEVKFSLNDNTLQKLSEKIATESENSKRIFITTKIDDKEDDSYIATTASVIDIKELEGKRKSEIKEYLKEIGFEENINELAKDITSELNKDEKERDWSGNVWKNVIDFAPKAIPFVLMLI